MQDNVIDIMVKQVAQSLQASADFKAPPIEISVKRTTQLDKNNGAAAKTVKTKSGLSVKDYPLAKNKSDKIKGLTGKGLGDITLEKVINDEIFPEDIRISGEVLNMQADIAQANGKRQFAENLRRAAEMTKIPDERVLEIYNMLRPNRSTKQQLLDVADELEKMYEAKLTAKFVRDAVSAYEQRGILVK
ncbi:MAG: diol dehydratase small subunit [Clostridia bacterium]|nr:diol dehydratase small subunit [Clostridia bacterium]